MNKTLQDQYLNIKEGKGHKGVFLTEVKRNFPNIVPQSADFALASKILKDKNIISENIVGIQAINTIPAYTKQPFETAFDNFLKEAKKKEENTKAEEKKTSKSVEETQDKVYDNKDTKNIDNLIFDQVMTGYYAELKDPKNSDKSMEELKAIVLKNLAKDPIYYTKDGQFGVKELGYTTEHPGLGTPKEVKGKYASSGMEPVKLNEIKSNTSKIFNWFWGEHESAKEIQRRIREYSNDVLLRLFKNKPSNITPKSPASVQQELLRKEINRRGLNIEDMSINESKLRGIIRSIIAEEMSKTPLNENQTVDIDETRGGGNYGILTITPGKGGGGKRFIPDHVILSSRIRKQFGDHMVYNPSSETFYVSQILYNNLVKGYADQPAIKKLIMDLPPMIKQLLNKTENYGTPTQLPKQYKSYVPFIKPVGKAESDKFNKVGDKQYWAAGDFKFPNINKDKYAPELAEELYEEESKIRNIIRSLVKEELSKVTLTESQYDLSKIDTSKGFIEPDEMRDTIEHIYHIISGNQRDYEQLPNITSLLKVLKTYDSTIYTESLNENLPKRLKEIETESLDEVKMAKLEKLKAEVEKRQSQLDMIESNEDLKGLTDGKKIKALQKEIKTLEKTIAKLEKTTKGAKKEVIDEVEEDDNLSQGYHISKRDLELNIDDMDDMDLDKETIDQMVDEFHSNQPEWMRMKDNEVSLLKNDLILKYLGSDND